MSAYYNEIDPKAAAWLRELIRAGVIAAGDVDDRDIRLVRPDDIRGYRQCHFFAGVGVWSYALRQAGWPDAAGVWTGSCPCQPFSDAGASKGFDDERHLWPHWFRLIRECRPGVVFGEQVASKDGLAWLDVVHADMESETYAVGAVDTCAAGFGCPGIRQRFFFVADTKDGNGWRRECGPEAGTWANGERRRGSPGGGTDGCVALAGEGRRALEREARRRLHDYGQPGHDAARCGAHGRLADADGWLESDGGIQRGGQHGLGPQDRHLSVMGDSSSRGCGERGDATRPRRSGHADRTNETHRAGAVNGFWNDADWLCCTDGKWRPVEPGAFPLVTGAPARLVRLRGYGNAINAEVARAFIEAYLDVRAAA